MRSQTDRFVTADGTGLYRYRWLPDGEPKAVVVVVHGMAEHAGRYRRFGHVLTDRGYAVLAYDQRGHGHTAAGEDELGFIAERGGWDLLVDDLRAVVTQARADHPGLPVAVFGHSMGSLVTRTFIQRHGDLVQAAVLSGTASDPGMMGRVGRLVALTERRVRGPRARSRLMDKLTFGSFNKAFAPARTDFDWLSRDPAEVDLYLEDPLCGVVSTTSFFIDLIDGATAVSDPRQVAGVPAGLPILLVAGALDPVGGQGTGVRAAAERFAQAGVGDVTCTLYASARHEILNETDRDEIEDDIAGWLDDRLSRA